MKTKRARKSIQGFVGQYYAHFECNITENSPCEQSLLSLFLFYLYLYTEKALLAGCRELTSALLYSTEKMHVCNWTSVCFKITVLILAKGDTKWSSEAPCHHDRRHLVLSQILLEQRRKLRALRQTIVCSGLLPALHL